MMTLQDIVAKANAVRSTLTTDFARVRAVVDQHELVIAVWADPREPQGVGTDIIKGRHLLEDIVATGNARELSWTAIPCTCLEQAIALRQVVSKSDLH